MENTKYLLLKFANHNKYCNLKMLNIIQTNISNAWNYELAGKYFKSLGEILDHIYVTENNWMKYLLKCSQAHITLDIELNIIDHNKMHFSEVQTFLSEREILDNLIIQFFSSVKEEFLIEKEAKEISGSFVPWEPVIHLFNHQAHHRGQISHILDEIGIENDYSSIITI